MWVTTSHRLRWMDSKGNEKEAQHMLPAFLTLLSFLVAMT